MPDLMTHGLTLAISDEEKIVIVFAILGSVAVVWIIAATIYYTLERRFREQTKRELAAYVAEGTIAPDDAARLLTADDDEVRKKIADGVAWGMIKPRDAQALMNNSGRAPPGTPQAAR